MADSGRFERFEYPNDDFPFYDGRPTGISGRQWLVVLGAVAVAFLVLIAPVPFFASDFGQFVPRILFPAIPLAALAFVAPRNWTALFRRVGRRDVAWMFGFALLNIVVSTVLGLLTSLLFVTDANAGYATLGERPPLDLVLFFLSTAPQLLGEEVFTILPFLAMMWFLFSRMGLPRRTSIVVAWLLSAVLFGAVHLPTYDWNLVQCFVVIGSARLILLLAYIKTKNTWVSAGAHVINDWTLFATTLLISGLAG
jgi:uncharacterized protein